MGGRVPGSGGGGGTPGSGGSGSTGIVDSFIFQPGGTGTGPVVFSDWAALDTAKEVARAAGGPSPGGLFEILFDTSFTTPAVIPSGAYDFTNCVLTGDGSGTRVDFADGMSCTGLRRIEGGLGIRNLNTVSPADTSLSDGDLVTLGTNCFANSVTTPIWSTALPGFFALLLGQDAAINFNFGAGAGSAIVVETTNPGSFLVVDAMGATLPSNGIDGSFVVYRSPTMTSFPDTAIPGLLLRQLQQPASLMPNPFLGAPASASVAAEHGQWLRLDTSLGQLTQVLPEISTTNPYKRPGVFLTVSDAGPSSQGLTLRPGGGDTINGSASGFVVPSLGGVILIGDGVSNWSVLNFAAGDAPALSTGVLTGCEVTVNAGNPAQFDVSAGTAVIVDWTGGTPSTSLIDFAGVTAVPVTGILASVLTALFLDATVSGGGVVGQQTGQPATQEQHRERVVLQQVIHADFLTITAITGDSQAAYDQTQTMLDYARVLGNINTANDFAPTSNNLQISKVSGSTTGPFINRAIDAQSPSTKSNPSAIFDVTNTFSLQFRDGVGGFTFSDVFVIDPDNYDDGSGVLAAMPNNQFQIQRIYFFGQTEGVVITYGQETYSNLAAAMAAINIERPITDPILLSAVVVDQLIVREGATDLSDSLTAVFVKAAFRLARS